MTIQQELQQQTINPLVEMYVIDLSVIGEAIHHFTPNIEGSNNVSFGGTSYLPLPLAISSVERSTAGSPPRAQLNVNDYSRLLRSYIVDNEDLVGCRVTRFLTLRKFLDDGTSPDGSQRKQVVTFVINQLESTKGDDLVFGLRNLIDLPNLELPRGKVTRKQFPGAAQYRAQRGV